MIFVHDKGRMANNILQYGHVYAWGREHGRLTMSMRFAYKYPWFHICDMPHHNFMTYVFAKYAAKWHLIPTIRFDKEDADYSHEEQLMLHRKMVLVGGWYVRYYELFLKYKKEILQLFAFTDQVERHVSAVLRGKGQELRLGVHIRRGDYATFHGGRFFYSDVQYVSVICQFKAIHPNEKLTVYICGNDPNLNRAYYYQELQDCEVVFPNGNPAEDLCLLSHCDYLIGAPSTFSLVAAMYRDLPLYWIEDINAEISETSFKHFDYLFQHIY
ncbi:MAG: alpha-1,2-fucosyltransferase [Prevotella sp.]|nr:alpha-1,2-fucosyltransferase [Prevotella sp.]